MLEIDTIKQYFSSHNFSIFDLDAIHALLDELGHPEHGMKCVHITGTNGKGSTGAYIVNILKESGYKVGQFSSPAVFEWNEIIRVNGENIDDESIVRLFGEVARAIDVIKAQGMREPTTFEIETAMAFLYFRDMSIDVAVLEVGMGGVMDSTNVVEDTMVEVVTRISYDHMGILGKTLREIATAKAGIIKANSTVITTGQDIEVMRVINRIAGERDANVIVAGDGIHIGSEHLTQTVLYKGREYETSLLGKYQMYNLPIAIECAKELRRRGYTDINDVSIMNGVAKTRLGGRFEVIGTEPIFVLDGAHNDEASNMLAESIESYFRGRSIVYLLGIFEDKDYRKILDNTMKYPSKVITFDWKNPRHMSGERLAEIASEYMANVVYAGDITSAVEMALADAGSDGVIVAFGSLSHLGEIEKAYKGVVKNG